MDSYNLAPFLPAVGLQRLFFLPVLRELGWGFPYLNSVLNSQIHSRRTCVYTVAPWGEGTGILAPFSLGLSITQKSAEQSQGLGFGSKLRPFE